jgi:hypothetical protein
MASHYDEPLRPRLRVFSERFQPLRGRRTISTPQAPGRPPTLLRDRAVFRICR